jgi:hypothetical protein
VKVAFSDAAANTVTVPDSFWAPLANAVELPFGTVLLAVFPFAVLGAAQPDSPAARIPAASRALMRTRVMLI